MGAIFEAKDGERISITTRCVSVEVPILGKEVVRNEPITYEAVATECYQIHNGNRRRLFVDASIEFIPGVRQIWLTDGESVFVNSKSRDIH